ncbi:hypothetical protein CCP2SC5_1280005 [Azospirillaceae bacterium]
MSNENVSDKDTIRKECAFQTKSDADALLDNTSDDLDDASSEKKKSAKKVKTAKKPKIDGSSEDDKDETKKDKECKKEKKRVEIPSQFIRLNRSEPISRAIVAISTRIFGKKSKMFGTFLAEWSSIMGPLLADKTSLEQVVFPRGRDAPATLKVRVSMGFATDFLHYTPVIIERINGFFGYCFVNKITILQNIPEAPQRRYSRAEPVLEKETMKLASSLTGIQSPELREALARFGVALKKPVSNSRWTSSDKTDKGDKKAP